MTLAGGRIARVREGPPERGELVLPDGILAPGLVDLQVNGGGDVDVPTASPADLRRLAAALPATGVTAFLPTVITAPLDAMAAALARVGEAMADDTAAGGHHTTARGARILGVHVEGPFLSPAFAAAHPAEHVRDPEPEDVDRLLATGPVRLLTLAPERPGAHAAIARARAAGVAVSIGHSDATAAQTAAAAADAGASMVTHLFNAQRGLHHREPGVAGRALVDERLTLGLIADLRHVAPDAVRLAFAAAGHRIALVTDAVAHTTLGGAPVDLAPDGRPTRADGTPAGTQLALDEAAANVTALGLAPAAALRAATTTPADAIGQPALGRLVPGAHADLAWLGDDLRARATWIAGRLVHGALPS